MADKDFTPRELEIMAKAWNCMTEEPKVNYDKLAEMCGMGNPRSASNAWAKIKAKVAAKGGITSANGDGEGTPKATPKKRAKGKATDVDDDEESPAKKVKGGKGGKGKKGQKEEVVEDGEEDASPVKEEVAEEEDGGFE